MLDGNSLLEAFRSHELLVASYTFVVGKSSRQGGEEPDDVDDD